VFRLKAEGAAPAQVSGLAALEGEGDVASPYTNVYARQLEWVPKGEQEERLTRPAAVVHGDILLAKLAPGQVIHLEAHAVKGIGKDHAKFSPVATASYRLHTTVELGSEFEGEEAQRLVGACPMGVFDIEDIAGGRGGAWGGVSRSRAGALLKLSLNLPFPLPHHTYPPAAPARKRAYVKDARKCTVCRECVRVPGWGERVRIERVANHFIFTVESTGALT
jgi:DNA-directed RNA polymerase I and III subunit RPAC1